MSYTSIGTFSNADFCDGDRKSNLFPVIWGVISANTLFQISFKFHYDEPAISGAIIITDIRPTEIERVRTKIEPTEPYE